MRAVRLYMTMSCDGFFAGPGGELDWMAAAPDPELNQDIVDLIGQADTAFMGYPVASGMIPYWRQVAANPAAAEGERAIADAVSRVHALVLSTTEVELALDNAELLVVRDDAGLREAVNAVRRQPGRDIGVPGGIRTARAFVRLGLFDEYVLMVHPVALGEGQRVFTQRTDLRLQGAKAYESGVTRLTYRPR
jgi:dihydrofolate reductase